MTAAQKALLPSRGRTLSKAAIRAAGLLGLAQAELAPILGLSRATISRMAAGDHIRAPVPLPGRVSGIERGASPRLARQRERGAGRRTAAIDRQGGRPGPCRPV